MQCDMLGFVFFAALHQLGVCLKEKGSPFDAESILRESLIIKRTAFPNNKTSIANSKCHNCIVAGDNVHL